MANETDRQYYEQVGRSFDAAALTLNELAAELVNIEQKYGRESTLLKKKLAQIQALRSLFDDSLKYINYLRNLNDRMFNEVMARDLEKHRAEMGLSYAQIGELIGGGDAERWKKMDHVDEVIRNAKKLLGLTDEEGSFESFIQTMRGENDSK